MNVPSQSQDAIAAALLPCGHPQACVASGAEGTHYCRWCQDVGRRDAEIARLRDALLAAKSRLSGEIEDDRAWVAVRDHLDAIARGES